VQRLSEERRRELLVRRKHDVVFGRVENGFPIVSFLDRAALVPDFKRSHSGEVNRLAQDEHAPGHRGERFGRIIKR